MRTSTAVAGMMLSASTAMASSVFSKRDSWGAAFSLGPAKQDIISTTTTIYPGKMPADQKGYLFVWLGISKGTGDLIQSIIGSYPAGGSECSGADADSTWCISSEVYGLASNGYPNQWVGSLTTADTAYENGIKLNYTLIDKESYLWLQTMEDAVTGQLLSTFNKTSGPMLGWGTALECNDYNGVACSGTTSEQYYVNSTIILESADDSFVDTLGAGTGVVYTDMLTSDGGKTWTIAKITIPAMDPSDTSSSAASSVAELVASSTPASVSSSVVSTEIALKTPSSLPFSSVESSATVAFPSAASSVSSVHPRFSSGSRTSKVRSGLGATGTGSVRTRHPHSPRPTGWTKNKAFGGEFAPSGKPTGWGKSGHAHPTGTASPSGRPMHQHGHHGKKTSFSERRGRVL